MSCHRWPGRGRQHDAVAKANSPPFARIIRFVGLFAFWSVIAVTVDLPQWMHADFNNWRLINFLNWWEWGVISQVIVAVDRRLPFVPKEITQRVGVHCVVGVLVCLLFVILNGELHHHLGYISWTPLTNPAKAWDWFVWAGTIYGLILGATLAGNYYHHIMSSELAVEKLKRAYTESRLSALRMQLDPHFLFNALNAISSLAERDPKLTRQMIERLGALLRASLDVKDRDEVPLSAEFALLDNYLELQRLRFGSRLKIETELAEAVRNAAVPSLLLQPIVENAIRHGISQRAQGGNLVITADKLAGKVVLRVLDDGKGLPLGWKLETAKGIGLSVTQERLAALYPDGGALLEVNRRAGGGTEVHIELPFRLAGK